MNGLKRGKGYIPDVPGAEDVTYKSSEIQNLLARTHYGKLISGAAPAVKLPASVDLRSASLSFSIRVN